MKKFIISSVFMFLMMFSSLPDAHAQEFCALGSYPAGEEISAYITLVSNEAEVEAQGLPEGLYLAETPGDMGKHLSLEGTSYAAGDLGFSISVSEEPGLISCSVHFEPAVPQLSVSGNLSCAVNDSVELYVSAGTPDSGTLSYQWYSGTGFTALILAGETGSTYRPDTSIPGQYTYFCEVTNYNNSHTSTEVSDVMYVTVAEPRITGIEIETMPAKLLYAPGDSIDTKGLSLRISYDNSSSEVIDHGFEVFPAIFNNPGKQLVELYYEGFHCYYEVEVSLSAIEVEGIGVVTLPKKLEYETGEYLDTTGLVIRAYTKDGHIDIDSGFEVSPQKFRDDGRQSVTVSFGGKSCSFTVNVIDSNEIKSVAIASLPTRREYYVGDTVDVSGLSLQLIYGGRTEIVSSGFSWSPQQLNQEGPQEITVVYGEHSAKFSINVKNAAAKPSPSTSPTANPSPRPSASPAPDTPAPSISPTRSPGDHQAKDVNAMVKIIFAVALLSLVGLGGYILWMQKRGRR